jgi:hypothetical protein
MRGPLVCLLEMLILTLVGIVMYWLICRHGKAADRLIERIER